MAEPQRFENSDAAYLRWLADHPDGWVANVDAGLGSYLKIHRARCTFAAFAPRAVLAHPFTGGQYVKVVADTLGALRTWAERGRLPTEDPLCQVCCRDEVWEVES